MALDISNISKARARTKKTSTSSDWLTFLKKDISFSKGLTDKSKDVFYNEMSLLMNSGVGIDKALDIIAMHFKKEKERKVINQIKQNLIEGKSFSESLEQLQGFSPYEYYSIRIGEEIGKTELVLTQLALFYKRKLNQRKQVVNALTYPFVVILTAFIAVGFMMNFVVPIFSEVFKQFDGELPMLTQRVIYFSDFISKHFLFIIAFFITIIATAIYFRNNNFVRKYSSILFIKLPFVGSLTKKIYTARFCHAMALLVSAHVPMLRAIEMVEKMIGLYSFELVMRDIQQGILKGDYLYQTIERSNLFDQKLVALVKVAEEVNRMDVVFNELSKQYTEDIENTVGVLGNILEPLLIIFVGLLVGVILVAMYLPLFQLSTSFG